jgi:hypothetical protein
MTVQAGLWSVSANNVSGLVLGLNTGTEESSKLNQISTHKLYKFFTKIFF